VEVEFETLKEDRIAVGVEVGGWSGRKSMNQVNSSMLVVPQQLVSLVATGDHLPPLVDDQCYLVVSSWVGQVMEVVICGYVVRVEGVFVIDLEVGKAHARR